MKETKVKHFLCKDRFNSPSVGVPVYVTDVALKNAKVDGKYRGGTIVEDLSFVDFHNNTYYVFRVKHADMERVWSQEDLVEVGGITLPPVNWSLPKELNN
ncbi:hypothetical protein ACS2BX_25875 [Bacillus cereus group sp. BceL300]|uniref:hypothetical protein n=1 Tax=Bacillus cereus group TaxID=86661 RepID=UPI0014443E11|nr:hypothetical protein [Bacillus cereus]NKW77412.1 hypothetical protein [Bacillus cereus]NKX14830.1 hypothetical protein [Bacillus cereus]